MQTEGFAAKFAFPYALEVCKGQGYDIGAGRIEWKLPGSHPIDPKIEYADSDDTQIMNFVYRNRSLIDEWNDIKEHHTAMDLPAKQVDYIFSSHCLEHLPDWVGALNYWQSKLRKGGVLFLYLPHPNQAYWRPWNNRKHIHILHPEDIYAYLTAENTGWTNVFVSDRDLNDSFMAMGEKL